MQADIMHGGKCVGTAEIEPDGLYWTIEAACCIDAYKVHRLWAHTEHGEILLGVLIPDGQMLRLSKKLPRSQVDFSESTVFSTDHIGLPPFSGTVGDRTVHEAYLLEQEGKRTLCIPYRSGGFDLMEFICFFRLERLDGRLFWMAELDGGNFPVFS